jgi:hypothetical protein
MAALSTTAYSELGAAVAKLLEHPKIKPLDGPLTGLGSGDDVGCVKSLNMAFLKALTGNAESEQYLETAKSGKFSEVGAYYCTAIDRIKKEISAAAGSDAGLESALKEAAAGDASGSISGAETFWKIFFPAGVNMLSKKDECIQEIRDRRKVNIEKLNPNPIKDPVKEMLFTSNVLLGLPPDSKPISSLNYSDDFKAKLEATSQEKQIAWFDHPIQIGVDPEGNEILYGLKGLDVAVGWEKDKGNIPNDAEMLTLLSITCTHSGLQAIGKQYVEEEFKALPETEKIKHLKIMLFSEIETDALVDTVLKPACAKIGFSDMDAMREIFGVEGQYGRHYSFLKAILAVYHCFIDSAVRATFKIDIDQLFIQDSIVAENDGMSMLDHFKTDRWGAIGKNWKGEEIELGMIAGALCNQKDWEANDKKLFIPDVLIPKKDKQLAADELVFFSGLPQAISTEAEMMWKYKSNDDVIQRIHVTGGTNGILVDTLFKHKPFAPSWIGRAEDQSYLFSTLGKPGTKMGYVHQPGLIMRHDKEAFAMEAMEAARIGKMVGDYERILLFSEYSKVAGDLATVKELVDPFTGGFCVPIPYTTTFIRFALKALGFAAGGATKDMVDFTVVGAPRVAKVIDFTKSDSGASELEKSFRRETESWDKFYQGLEAAKGDAAIADAARVVFEKATCAH